MRESVSWYKIKTFSDGRGFAALVRTENAAPKIRAGTD